MSGGIGREIVVLKQNVKFPAGKNAATGAERDVPSVCDLSIRVLNREVEFACVSAGAVGHEVAPDLD